MAPRQRQVNTAASATSDGIWTAAARSDAENRHGTKSQTVPNARQPVPPSTIRRPKWHPSTSNLSTSNSLPELVAKAQAGLASREKQNRKDLRAELERRVAGEGYKMADIFPELGAASSSSARRKWPAKYRNPQNPDTTWSGLGRTPKWVQAILDERGIDRAAFKSIPMYQIHASS